MKTQTKTQTKKEKELSVSLAELISRKRNNGAMMTAERIRGLIKGRMVIATAIRNSELNRVRVSSGLTDYANSLLETKFKDLYNLIYDYAGNRMHITHLKHELLQQIRVNHTGNVTQQLAAVLKNEAMKMIKEGRLRNSDKTILSKI